MPQRDLVLIALVVVVLAGAAAGRICPDMDVRNSPGSLEKLRNCTIIMGYLQVVLMDSVKDEGEFDGYSFPELTEVVDYVLVYRIMELSSLKKLFPNLRVIRGRKLFAGHALAVFKVPHLEEIGLTGLQHIGRGAIKVDGCPNVCYVRTVDWESLGASKLDFPSTEASDCKDQFCPTECRGFCWNNIDCQKSNANYCADYTDEGKCVAMCPASKVVNKEARICQTEDECASMLNGTWWVSKGACVNACPIFYKRDKTVEGGCRYVGKDYTKVCDGETVNTLDVLEAMEGCTYIEGFLEIRLSHSVLEPFLEKYLGNIVTITEYLKVGRSPGITSLEFLKNLTTIKGEKLDNNRYSLFVFENENLRKLWNFSDSFKLSISNGTMAFHDNPQLCLHEIEKLASATGMRNNETQISKYTNGYKSICNQKDVSINITENNPTNVTIVWEKLPDKENETVIGYTVYYKPGDNPLIDDNEDACDAGSWYGIFVRENKVQLKDLIPYTPYIYYIKTLTTETQSQQTPIHNFTTASSEPSEPLGINAEAISDSSIVLNWSPPEYPNGDLSHYKITMFIEADYLPTIRQRNYCENPHVLEIEEHITPTNTSLNATKLDNCTCPAKNITQLVTEDLTCTDDSNDFNTCVKDVYHHEPISFISRSLQKREMSLSSKHDHVQSYDVQANLTTYEFKHLKHFSLYVFFLRACNSWKNKENERVECGKVDVVYQRTKKKENADIIRTLRVEINSKNAKIKWLKPAESNSVLVAYQIEYKRTDSEHSKPRVECITEEEYQTLGGVYKIRNLSPGKYSVHVQAISFAGPGLFSEWKDFEIRAEATSPFTIIGPIGAVIVVAFISVMSYLWYRKKHPLEINHLITSVNPDYAGPNYVEDEWEIERNDIQIIKEVGQGSFGMVYEGLIRSRRQACAIKTVNESASMSSRFEFLNEGSVMKTFSDGYHVVKLLGIVSRGQPPLVVMELMERGDLKSYLRRCREPSQNLTTNELYRMAAEIADGMAYLCAKKFIHRDLAARNCMVAADRTVKIGDFGMARDVYETDYYRKETVGLLPVRWMSPESLADGVFTRDSDIWSYGVVLWEMATLAEQPYQGLSNEQVFHFVKTRGKLERPSECSDFLFEVMDRCWSWRPNDRPTFYDVVHRFVDHVGEDFRLVAFCFSRQGREWQLNAGPRPYNPPAMVAGEDDYFGHYDPSEEEVNLYVRDQNRPRYLPFSNQRNPSPDRVSPGSPSSAFSFNSS